MNLRNIFTREPKQEQKKDNTDEIIIIAIFQWLFINQKDNADPFTRSCIEYFIVKRTPEIFKHLSRYIHEYGRDNILEKNGDGSTISRISMEFDEYILKRIVEDEKTQSRSLK